MKAQLARLGVQMKVEMLDKVTWMDRFITRHEFQLTFGNVTGFTIGAFAPLLESTSSMNFSRHTDTKVDALFQHWRTTIDPSAHAQATAALQTYLAEQLYLTGFANTPFFHGARAHVKGVTVVDKLVLQFETAWLEQ